MMRLGTIQGTLPSFVTLKYSIRKVKENHEMETEWDTSGLGLADMSLY
jgi:hypothetical protein